MKFLLPTLVEAGRGDVALMLSQQKTAPSFVYMVEQGATTLWVRGFARRLHAVSDVCRMFIRNRRPGSLPDTSQVALLAGRTDRMGSHRGITLCMAVALPSSM